MKIKPWHYITKEDYNRMVARLRAQEAIIKNLDKQRRKNVKHHNNACATDCDNKDDTSILAFFKLWPRRR